MEYVRDYAMYAAVFGIFSFSWFGWAQQDPPKKWPVYLGILSGLGFIVGTVGGLLAWQNWDKLSALNEPNAYRLFGVVAAIEILAIIIATLILFKMRKQAIISSIVGFIVGLHFIPLAPLFNDNWLYLLAGLMMTASILPLFVAKKLGISTVTMTGVSVGALLFIFALRGLALFVTS